MKFRACWLLIMASICAAIGVWPSLLSAERQSASLEIRATVPSYCKFKVDNSFNKDLKLDEVGKHRAHIANLELDCNIISGYKIIANSVGKFNLTNTKTEHMVPYKLVIDSLGEGKIVNETSQAFMPEVSTDAKKYAVFLEYEVIDTFVGEYNDNVEFALDFG